jgi:hypothetical protein
MDRDERIGNAIENLLLSIRSKILKLHNLIDNTLRLEDKEQLIAELRKYEEQLDMCNPLRGVVKIKHDN